MATWRTWEVEVNGQPATVILERRALRDQLRVWVDGIGVATVKGVEAKFQLGDASEACVLVESLMPLEITLHGCSGKPKLLSCEAPLRFRRTRLNENALPAPSPTQKADLWTAGGTGTGFLMFQISLLSSLIVGGLMIFWAFVLYAVAKQRNSTLVAVGALQFALYSYLLGLGYRIDAYVAPGLWGMLVSWSLLYRFSRWTAGLALLTHALEMGLMLVAANLAPEDSHAIWGEMAFYAVIQIWASVLIVRALRDQKNGSDASATG